MGSYGKVSKISSKEDECKRVHVKDGVIHCWVFQERITEEI